MAFQRVYANPRDELIRKKMFIANALKTFFHNMGFRMGKFSYFLSINQFTDNTPEEIKKMYSGLKLGTFKRNSERNQESNKLDDIRLDKLQQQAYVDTDLDQLKQELTRIIEEKQPGYEILAQELSVKIDDGTNKRKMRSSATRKNMQANIAIKGNHANLEINDFRSMEDDIVQEESSKFVGRVPSTNDQYRPIERVTESNDEITNDEANLEVPEWRISSTQYVRNQLFELSGGDKGGKVVSHNARVKRSPSKDNSEDADEPGLENRLFVDWRESGCLTMVRDQRRCGSCYAFATVAMMEFLHCEQTGKLVPFSEQYMVDCGKGNIENMNGCDGSDLDSMAEFVEVWGVELSSNYPYVGLEKLCPYDKSEMRSAGFKRPSFVNFRDIYQRVLWEEILKETGPMIATIVVPIDFSFYGGMVHQGRNCLNEDDMHAMLLIGHGIEDGQEYWLYKNSHGYYWGEDGYFKLSKNADNICFGPHAKTKFRF